MINFAEFTVQKSANERVSLAGKARGQNFKLKFRKFLSNKGTEKKIDTVYTVSNAKFAELDLHNHGIIQVVSPEGVPYIAVVSNDDATMLKRTDKLKAGSEKGKKFKSTILDGALLKAGIIEDKEGTTQFLDLVKVADATKIGNLDAIAVYQIVKGEGEDDEQEEENEEVTEGREVIEEDSSLQEQENLGGVQESSASNTEEESTEDDF